MGSRAYSMVRDGKNACKKDIVAFKKFEKRKRLRERERRKESSAGYEKKIKKRATKECKKPRRRRE